MSYTKNIDEALRERFIAHIRKSVGFDAAQASVGGSFFGDNGLLTFGCALAFAKSEIYRAKGYPENPCTGAEFVAAMKAAASHLSTGAEFVAAMKAAASHLSDECFREAIEEAQGESDIPLACDELATLRALCRRVAEHLNNEHHIGLKDPATNAALIAELEHAGWDEKGKER